MAAINRDGYVLLPSIVSPAQQARLRAFIDAQPWPPEDPKLAAIVEKVRRASQSGVFGSTPPSGVFVPAVGSNRQHPADFTQMEELLPFMNLPEVVDVVESLHGADCRVIGGSLWVTGRGRKQPIHVDYQPIRLPDGLAADPRIIVPCFISTAHIYLDDLIAEPELGPT